MATTVGIILPSPLHRIKTYRREWLTIINRNIYLKDPSERKLVNEGVANVSEDQSKEALDVLRYELETFVCDGQYKQGLHHILETYLKNIEQAQQPAVWVSGFFGSGKSHLVKMLRALWVDLKFDDGATARSIADLPTEIQDQFKELSMQAKRHGGLNAASGTLGSAASGSVRLALLRIVFKSAGLPEQYPVARFILWLKSEGIYDQVRELVEQKGYTWQEELDNFYVAEGLHEAFANIYSDFVDALHKKQAGEAVDEAEAGYPTIDMAIDGVKFINKCVESMDKGSVWVDVD